MNATALLAGAILVLAVDATQRDNKPQTVTRMRDVVRKVDTETFTGKIEAIDPAKYTLTINGHEIIERRHHKVEVHERWFWDKNSCMYKLHKPPPPKKNAAPAANAKRTFKIDPMCKVSTAKKPVAMLTDLQVGDTVTVSYNIVSGVSGKTARTVTGITPARTK